jgi:hypothetical protein
MRAHRRHQLASELCLHEIRPARLIYPKDGPVSGYYHLHPDPVVPVWWRVDEIAASVEQVIALYGYRNTAPPARRSSIAAAPMAPDPAENPATASGPPEPAHPAPATAIDAPRRIS